MGYYYSLVTISHTLSFSSISIVVIFCNFELIVVEWILCLLKCYDGIVVCCKPVFQILFMIVTNWVL